ncbi:hypothetical protein QBC46DRAFT_6096 [Diplogelasinospora grovesii]|uniref:LsmAD domain-containing protein n=1 Tax=Diplogelasinospora grovesii TaxID=303347 RepID=A0AAN6NJV8_9PEZI|nr:hypothetical protein QBC46DRAFT_6096 [Diplogelasinospora grovesii]
MDDRSSKPAISSPSQSTTPDIKSPTARPLYSSKLGDQRGNTSGPTTRQPAVQQKAWTSAKNPITGRSHTPQPSFNSQSKQSVLYSLREGQRVRITLASGAEFEGTYANSPESSTCRLTMVQQKKLPHAADITNGTARKEQPTMSFQRKDIADARVLPGNAGRSDGKAPNGRSSFRTDAAISNSRVNERVLKPWVPDSTDAVDGSLEKSNNAGGTWDQFAENERLFGLKTDYDESIYTTSIDKSHPQYKERMAAAEKKAREIERSTASTAHVAEERIMDFVGGDDNGDEEAKYSGVRRGQDFPPLQQARENKYTPPARRAPTGQATVKGAPVDPAIISSQLKAPPTQKQVASKAEEPKAQALASKSPTTPIPESKPSDPKVEAKVDGKVTETKAVETKPESKALDVKPSDNKTPTTIRPSATTGRTISPQVKEGVAAPSATATVERDVLKEFKSFATAQRHLQDKIRSNKAKADKEVKLTELKRFADSFKLSTPVPKDLISIIAKDPVKQKQIQEKALQNAEEIQKQKAAAEAAAQKEKEAAAAKENQTKTVAEQTPAAATPAAVDPRANSRAPAPHHSNSPSNMPNRHPGGRSSYNPQSHYQQYGRNNRGGAHLNPQIPPTGQLAQRLRSVEQQKMQHPHMSQHPPVQDMRLPPTGPANNADPSFGRRVPQSYLGPKLNPNSHEFRPNAFAQPFNPAGPSHGPSQGSSPRSSVNNVVDPSMAAPIPVAGQLIRRKTKAVDVKKCLILSHIQTLQPPQGPQGRSWEENGGLKPSFDTHPTWRQLQDETEKPDSTMYLTYKQYFERMPVVSAAMATPNPPHVMPQMQHQLPFHMQHGAPGMAPRQSPHMPPMQMHGGQQGHVPHVSFNPDDHRMMHSNSAQSFASPRMGQVSMAYPPAMNTPAQMQYSTPVMQPYMNPGTPQMGQYRSFSNNPQFMPQQPPHMAAPMMPQFITPNGMVAAAGAPVHMYPGAHPQFIPPGSGPPQPMAGSNGFPSPGRPVAPMMAHQGSHQGQPPVYGMSPGMPYQAPAYTPQQPQGKFSNQRPQ